MRHGVELRPPFQPDLVATETQGLPAEIVKAAKAAVKRREQVTAET